MHIKKITNQYRRDFRAIYECEHCDHTVKGVGYDDAYFHEKVVPAKECPRCGETASSSYRPLSPKYPEGVQV